MILPLLLQAATPPADVVVTAERLRRLRLSAAVEGGRLTGCTVTVSSGDAALDRAACAATRACAEGGIASREALANCADARVIDFVRSRPPAASDQQ